MQQQQEQQDQIGPIPLLTHGSAELLTSAHQWDSLHPDTQSLDLRQEAHPEEEAAADSQEEEEVDSQVGELQADTVPNQEIRKEDHQEIDSSAMPRSSIMVTTKGQKSSWQPGSYTRGSIGGPHKWTTCIDGPCFFLLTFRDPQQPNGCTPSVTGLNKPSKFPMSSTNDSGTTQKKCFSENLKTHCWKNEPSPS